jgi:hypothetical protein
MDKFESACLSGNLELVKSLPISENKDEIFIKVCGAGHLDIIKWMYSMVDAKTHDNAVWCVCKNNHLETAKFLYSLGIAKFNVSIIMGICELGYFDMVKWIFLVHDSFPKYYAFSSACSSGNLEIAKWLLQLDPNIEIYADGVFIKTCCNGHLDIAKWLYQLNPNMDITYPDIFHYTCVNGHLEVAKWLFQLNPNIETCNIIFYDTCYNGHLEVAKWLYQIYPNININTPSGGHTIFTYITGQYLSVIDNPDMVKWFVEIGVEFNNYSEFHLLPKECKQLLLPIIKPEKLNKAGLAAYLIETNNVIPYAFEHAPPHAKIRGMHTKPAPRD